MQFHNHNMNKEYETQDEETTTKQFDINPSTDTHTLNIETTKQTVPRSVR